MTFTELYLPYITLDAGTLRITWDGDINSVRGILARHVFNKIYDLLELMGMSCSRDIRDLSKTVMVVENANDDMLRFVQKFVDDGCVIKL